RPLMPFAALLCLAPDIWAPDNWPPMVKTPTFE
ncbi:MAG: hypothetical protein ACJAUC_000250, partial [Planctomycetota bacterium]